MNIILNKINSCLKDYSNEDLNELNNRLNIQTIDFTFKSFLKIENNDYKYMLDDLKIKHSCEIETKSDEINNLRVKLDTIKTELHNYKRTIQGTIQEKSIEISDSNTKYLQNQIIDLKKQHEIQLDSINNTLNKQYQSQINSINNNFQTQLELYKEQLKEAQNKSVSQDNLKHFEETLIRTINEKPNIHSENSNIKGQFGEQFIDNIQNNYKLCQEFELQNTTKLESNGDFIAHNIYPNISDKILIESKFVKNLKCSQNTKHGKSDLLRFEDHTNKFFKENPYSHSIIFSMNSDTIPGKGSYHIENIDNHLIFYVSINYSKINNDETFQHIINFIFHTIVMYIVETSHQNKINTTNDNTANFIKLLENTYHNERKTINILENKIQVLEKDILDFNNIISLHKTNIENISIKFNEINHNLKKNNDSEKKHNYINIDEIYTYIKNNGYNISFLDKTTRDELKTLFPKLPSKFNKKKLIQEYIEYVKKETII